MKNGSTIGAWIFFAIIMAAIIIAPNFSSITYVTNTETINQLDNTKDGICHVSLSANVITEGDLITGEISAEPNILCSIYGNLDNTGWLKISEGMTDSSGDISITDNLNVPGNFELRAICGSCTTNTENLVVNPLETHICEDSDGVNKLVPGHVDIDGETVGYDVCEADGVREYICDGEFPDSEVIPCDDGYECVETRSGGYCELLPEEDTCTDSDGGLIIEVQGICSSSVSMTAIQDTCESQLVLSENICNHETKLCENIIASCPPNTICIEGACRIL